MKKLSVIVPVYKAEKFIFKSLSRIRDRFKSLGVKYEVIAVVDGMLDDSYKEAKRVKGVKVVGYEHNMGKGFALKFGFDFVTGDWVTFVDCDMDLDPWQLKNFIPYTATADLVIGSKRHPFSLVHYSSLRHILSVGFNWLARLVLWLPLRDTQAGLKLIKKDVLDLIMPLVLVKKYAFDAELCFLAHKNGFRIVEAPLFVDFQKSGSTISNSFVSTVKTVFSMFIDILAIRYRYSFRGYYQKKYQKLRFR